MTLADAAARVQAGDVVRVWMDRPGSAKRRPAPFRAARPVHPQADDVAGLDARGGVGQRHLIVDEDLAALERGRGCAPAPRGTCRGEGRSPPATVHSDIPDDTCIQLAHAPFTRSGALSPHNAIRNLKMEQPVTQRVIEAIRSTRGTIVPSPRPSRRSSWRATSPAPASVSRKRDYRRVRLRQRQPAGRAQHLGRRGAGDAETSERDLAAWSRCRPKHWSR